MSPEGGALELRVAYAPEFLLRFVLNKAERVVSVDSTSWKFEVQCLIRHSTGKFTYAATDLFIDADCFEVFEAQLRQIGSGQTQEAKLADKGEMFSFVLKLNGRRLQAAVNIREYQGDDELTILRAGFGVDYDLFVNKLRDDLAEFNAALRSVIPEDV